jgi:SAM-dependent methyltransferase
MHREDLVTARRARTGFDVVVSHQLDLVSGAVPKGSRVLEVGCGRGELAGALGALGYAVTAIDPAMGDMPVVRGVRFEKAAVEDFTADAPFDAIAFTTSLHHVADLGKALDAAAALLAPRGLIVVDEFDVRAPDDVVALWFYELQELLAVAGIFDPKKISGSPGQPPLERWLAGHTGDDGRLIHDGPAMIAAIRERFTTVEISGGPYLYRYVAAGARGPRAPWIVEAIRDSEQRRIALGLMPPVGLTIGARAKPR